MSRRVWLLLASVVLTIGLTPFVTAGQSPAVAAVRAEEEAFGRSSGDDRGAGFSAAQQAITRIDTKAAHLRFRMAGIAVLNENRANSGFKKNIGILAESRDPDGRESEKQTHGELEEDL